MRIRFVACSLIISLVTLCTITGCTAQQKPVPSQNLSSTRKVPGRVPTQNLSYSGSTQGSARPNPGNPNYVGVAPNHTGTPARTPDPALDNRLAGLLARTGNVAAARVVITDNTAYVALRPIGATGPAAATGATGARLTAIRNEVVSIFRRQAAFVDNIYLTTDSRSYSQLNRVSQGNMRHSPLAGYKTELKDVVTRATKIRIPKI
ncbi:MAG TPA: YhcN/YlaJ family sporulation lipoprotein [Bacillota bacterium]|nr:YhcN/YlaJ family sporulation lipoprotein [Bacillota bacterium]